MRTEILVLSLVTLLAVPATVTATIQETQVIVAPDGQIGDWFGRDVDLDGDSAIVGANGAQAAYIYERVGESWVLEQKLSPAEVSSGDAYGYSVSIEGDRAVVGAPHMDIEGRSSGTAYVYTRDASTGEWTKELRFEGWQDAGDELGWAVDLEPGHDSHQTLAVSLPDSGDGEVHVWDIASDGTWDGPSGFGETSADGNARFGQTLDLNRGNLLVAAPSYPRSGHLNEGAAFLYDLGGTGAADENPFVPAEDVVYAESVAVGVNDFMVGNRDSIVDVYSLSSRERTQTLNPFPTPNQAPGEGGVDFGESIAMGDGRALVGDSDAYEFRAGGLHEYVRADDGEWALRDTTVAYGGDLGRTVAIDDGNSNQVDRAIAGQQSFVDAPSLADRDTGAASTYVLTEDPAAVSAPERPSSETCVTQTVCVEVEHRTKIANLTQPTGFPDLQGVGPEVEVEQGSLRIDAAGTFVEQAILLPRVEGNGAADVLDQDLAGIATTNYTRQGAFCVVSTCQFQLLQPGTDVDSRTIGEVWSSRLRVVVDGNVATDVPFTSVQLTDWADDL